MGHEALIVIDVQNDFLPGGALAVPEGDLILPTVRALIDHFDHVILTQDWHPQHHKSFASNHTGFSPYDTIKNALWHAITMARPLCTRHNWGGIA